MRACHRMVAAVAPKKLSGTWPRISVAIQITMPKMPSPYVSTPATMFAGITRMMRNSTAARFSRPVVTATSTG